MTAGNCGPPTGIFGGSFDPVHLGHLRTAFELCTALGLGEVRLVPSARPPHRSPAVAPAALRLQMLTSAVAGVPGLVVDDREHHRGGPSWTVDTLQSFRDEAPDRALCLIVGMDAFLGLPGWHRWSHIFELAHVVVACRPGWQRPTQGVIARVLDARGVDAVGALHQVPAGCILIHEVTQFELASSAIRQLVAGGGDPRFLVPDPVRQLILDSGCYRAGALSIDDIAEDSPSA